MITKRAKIAKILILSFVPSIALILISGCAKPNIKKQPDKVYTQVGMWYLEKITTIKTHRNIMTNEYEIIRVNKTIPSVNYSRFFHIPVNTVVTIIDENQDNAILFKHNGEQIVLINKNKYTGLSEEGLEELMFSTKPVSLNNFSDSEIKNIEQGTVELNMTKEAVILSRGYPPRHRTQNLDRDIWRYWEGRFDSKNYIFENNMLIRIDD